MNGDVTGSHIPLDPVENRQSRVIRQANVQDDGVREILPRYEHTFIGGFGNEALESCFMRKVAENPSEGSIVLHNEDYPAVPGQLLSVILDGWRDRKSVVEGKSVSVRVDHGGRRNIKKKKQTKLDDKQRH